jgi:ribosomal-protein-alanine N-acetyltransferase
MRFPFMPARDFTIAPLRRGDSAELERLHREDFVRPWTDAEFAGLLAQDAVFGYGARETGRRNAPMAGFVLARLAAGEAEILSIAVARSCRRLGLGRRLMDAVLRELHGQRAEALFLEVDETNAPAVALYRRLGFREVGKRPGYYAAKDGQKSGALVMRRDLR